PKTDFSFSDPVENIPVEFLGEDLTITDDEITAWDWDFGGLGTADIQNPSFTFLVTEDILVELTVATLQGCSETIQKTLSVQSAIEPTVSFSTVSSPSCIGENIPLSNNSINAQAYFWDFCPQSYLSSSSILFSNDISEVDAIYDLAMASYGETAFAFVSDYNNDDIARISFSDFPNIDATDFLTTGISAPKGIKMFETKGNWWAIVTNNDNDVFRLSFGDDLNTEPSVELIDNYGISDLRSLDIIQNDSGDIYAIIAGGGTGSRVIVLDFGDAISNTPSAKIHTTSGAYPSDVALVHESENWFAILSTVGSGPFILDFGNDIMVNSPTITPITGIGKSAGVVIKQDETGYAAFFATTTSADIYRAQFGTSINNPNPTIENLGDYNTLSTTIGLDLLYHEASYALMAGTLNDQNLTAISFEKNCEVSQLSSQETAPTNIRYSATGSYPVTLTAYNEQGIERAYYHNIEVNSSSAPNISFS
ncbi:hypothetical protein, partial [Reichenbachiella sp. MSK19-1]|uniref:hypothetical protein n=1 Tax=Reichenbachiella sp. MSK19-1 TaxID=1897631 RepID=UPI00131477B1